MKTGLKRCGQLLILLCILLACRTGMARDDALERIGDFGTIDWIGQKVSATGLGVAGDRIQNPAQARAMAKRAAVVVARRNLLEVVKGIRIDSSTTVVDYAVQDDTIVARVQGVLNHSSVDAYRYLSDGSVEATVSMPFSGPLGDILTRTAARSSDPSKAPPASPNVSDRIRLLENRVQALEERLSGLRQLGLDQKEQLDLFRRFIRVWTEYVAAAPVIRPVDASSGPELSTLKAHIERQAVQVRNLSTRLDDIARRLADMESGRQVPVDKKARPAPAVAYTGLIVDARGTDFRPCLKPELYDENGQIYPGAYIDLNNAVRRGYVRYYREIAPAQQSSRSGSLPYTIKTTGTVNGRGTLAIDAKDADVLRALLDTEPNFLAECRVIIVF